MERSVGGKPPPPPDLPVVGSSSTSAEAPTFAAAGVPIPTAAGAFPAAAGAPSFAAGQVPILADVGADSPPARAPPLVGVGAPSAGPSTPAAAFVLGGVAAADLGRRGAQPPNGAQQPPLPAGRLQGVAQQPLPAAGRQQGAPSFAQLFTRPSPQVAIPVCVHSPAATDQGRPAAFFSTPEVHASCTPLEYAVVAKTPQGRPPFPIIRAHFAQRFNFAMDFLIAPLDGRYLIITLRCWEDYLKLVLKPSMSVQGKPFRFFKWTIEFSPEADSPLVPVWLELPRLPANFYFEPMLRSIAGSIGPVLQIAQWTLQMTRMHAAAVCVELDVSQPLPDSIWIGIGSDGFWQPIEYPDPPRFCNKCFRLGHLPTDCKKAPAPSNPSGGNNRPAAGIEQVRKQPVENVIWRPTAAKPAAAPKQVNPVEHAKQSAQKVFANVSQPDLSSGSRRPDVQVRVQGVYLTPPNPSQHKRNHTGSVNILHTAVSSEEGGPLVHQQQQKLPQHHDQMDASQALDEMPQTLDQISLNAKAPAANVGIPVGLPTKIIHAVSPPQPQVDISQMSKELDQQLGPAAEDSAASSGGGVLELGGLSPKLNPAAPAWSPPLRAQSDANVSEEYPILQSAASQKHSQTSARGKKPDLPAAPNPDAGRILLPVTHDVMCFPGIPAPSEDFLPKMHVGGQSSHPAAKGSAEAMLPDIPVAQGSGEATSPHTPATGKAPASSSPPQGRVSFATAIRKKLRASDTRRTEMALEESDEPSSGSSSEEEDPPDPPPPPPLVADWVQAAAPGKVIIGLPATQIEAQMPKMHEKEGGEPKLPTRQTRQTLRRGFL